MIGSTGGSDPATEEAPMTRRWYLMFKDGDDNITNLVGPFKTETLARFASARLLSADKTMTDGIDWNDPDVFGVPFFNSVAAIDLSPDEARAVTS